MPDQHIDPHEEPEKFIVKDPPVFCVECEEAIDYMAVREGENVYHRDCYLEVNELGLDHKVKWAPGEPAESEV
ncbi:MAG: hypothetical protein ACLFN7_01235 [Candidatus Acetothermia bacterium]